MPPKMGRPKSDNPKCIELKVRVDEEFNAKLLKYCEENHITRSEAFRKGFLLLLSSK